ncbi:MAG: hypothetical protein Q8K75_01540 [Chlamydiales bacterium]|nr:hypothetical protein [Chlamydiales bacterium]
MCFSAEASFVAAAIVGTVGFATVKQVTEKRQLPLALLPVLFALQQLCEGVLWVYLTNKIEPNSFLTGVYVMFAFVLWPTWFSFSALMLEQVEWRKKVLTASLIAGIGVSIFFVWLFSNSGAKPEIVGNSIFYGGSGHVGGFFYLSVLSLPFLFSSVPHLWAMGVAAPVSFAFTAWFYWANFASIWCYFAAFISIYIFFVMKKLHDQKVKRS